MSGRCNLFNTHFKQIQFYYYFTLCLINEHFNCEYIMLICCGEKMLLHFYSWTPSSKSAFLQHDVRGEYCSLTLLHEKEESPQSGLWYREQTAYTGPGSRVHGSVVQSPQSPDGPGLQTWHLLKVYHEWCRQPSSSLRSSKAYLNFCVDQNRAIWSGPLFRKM